jgi:hypothetical protein
MLIGNDKGWLGVDMRVKPHLLPPGYASFAKNMRFTAGIPESRLGPIFPPWLNLISGTTVLPWTSLHGIGSFCDPATRFNYVIVAAGGKIYYTLANNAPVEMTLPAGTTITGTVNFTQAGGRLICHRGFDTAALWCEDLASGWTVPPSPAANSGADGLPNLERSIYAGQRLWGFKDDDTVVYSDPNNPAQFQPVTQEFYINPGASDAGVALYKWGRSTIVIFKRRSIFVLYEAYGDLSTSVGDTITLQFGAASAEAIVDVGNELWFLASDGTIRALVDVGINETGRLKLKTVTNAAGQTTPWRGSDPMEPIFAEARTRDLSGAVAAYCDNKFYVALPAMSDTPGDDLIAKDPAHSPYGTGYLFEVPAWISAEYRWYIETVTGQNYTITHGQYESHWHNGATVITPVAGKTITITSAGTVYLVASSGTSNPTAIMREDWSVSNTRLCVYDFVAGAWAGYDDMTSYGVEKLFPFPLGGRDVLACLTSRGYVGILEQDYQDKVPAPYADVEVASVPAAGDTLQVGGGDTVTAIRYALNLDTDPDTSAAGDYWGTIEADLAKTRRNLFCDSAPSHPLGGYSLTSLSMWTHPNTVARRLLDSSGNAIGVRFVSTNGAMPTIVTTGTWATITYHNHLPIEAELITRGYALDGLPLLNGATVSADLETWMADVSVSVVDGDLNDATALTDFTLGRTLYYRPSTATAYDPQNTNADWAVAHRQDYSVQFGSAVPHFHITGNDVVPGRHAQARYRETTSAPIEFMSGRVRFLNSTGRMRLLSCALESNPAGARASATG